MSEKGPSLTVLRRDGPAYQVLLAGVSSAVANTVRRAMMAYVPTLAIDEVIFDENSTSFYREYIAHRLSLIPIKTIMSYAELVDNYFEPKAEVDMVLDVRATGDTTVYASELKFPDGSVATDHPRIPIISMTNGQSLRAEIRARIGTGREHAKWQPISAASVVDYPVIELKSECDDCSKCAEACPTGAIGVEGGRLVVRDELACTLCEACVEACPEAISVKGDKERHVLSFELNGQLDARTTFMTALEILNRELSNILSQLEVLVSEEKAN
jgi:DNA-directed RNA polymerase subunit D